MKVLHVIPSIGGKSGGPGQAIIPMCRALAEHGIEVLLATSDADLNGESKPECGRVAVYSDQQVIFFPKQLGNSFKYSRLFAKWLDQNVINYDLVHIHAVFNHACTAAARACRRQGVPYIVRPLGTLDPWSMARKSLRKQLFWRTSGKRFLTGAAAVHYTAKAEQQMVERSLGLNHGVVVPLGVNLPNGNEPVADEFRRTFALGDSPYILVLSRLLKSKGISELLEAFLMVISTAGLTDWRLVLAGEGKPDYIATLKRRLIESNDEGRLVFTGWLEGGQKLSALNGAALLALPSYHESFGLCVLEAMAFGVPVLVSPQVNLAPEIEIASAGWVSKVDNASLVTTLAEAITSAEERYRRGLAGRRVAAGFAWPIVAANLASLYRIILKNRIATN
jgi:glycosyltransferase involved in cell wall biosynthesis